MSLLVKIVLGLALTVPMTAYVVGSLVASADDPAPRETIVLERTADDRSPQDGGDGRDPGKQGGDRQDDGRKQDDGGDEPDEVEVPEDDDPDEGDTVVPEIQGMDGGDDSPDSGPGPRSGQGGGGDGDDHSRSRDTDDGGDDD